jgi:hypothetical protein
MYLFLPASIASFGLYGVGSVFSGAVSSDNPEVEVTVEVLTLGQANKIKLGKRLFKLKYPKASVIAEEISPEFMKVLNETILDNARPHNESNSDDGMNSGNQKICSGMGAQAHDRDGC